VRSLDKAEIEQSVQKLFLQLDELKTAIQALQTRSLELTNEIREIRLAYETLTNIQQYGQVDTMASLDRYGYVYVRIRLEGSDKAIVRIGRDLYVVAPVDTAKSILLNFEKDVTDELRKTEAELKQLLNIYSQIQNKLQEYLAILAKEEERPR